MQRGSIILESSISRQNRSHQEKVSIQYMQIAVVDDNRDIKVILAQAHDHLTTHATSYLFNYRETCFQFYEEFRASNIYIAFFVFSIHAKSAFVRKIKLLRKDGYGLAFWRHQVGNSVEV